MITYDLENLEFRRWWIRRYAHKIVATGGMLEPTQQDFVDFLDEELSKL